MGIATKHIAVILENKYNDWICYASPASPPLALCRYGAFNGNENISRLRFGLFSFHYKDTSTLRVSVLSRFTITYKLHGIFLCFAYIFAIAACFCKYPII